MDFLKGVITTSLDLDHKFEIYSYESEFCIDTTGYNTCNNNGYDFKTVILIPLLLDNIF